MSVLIHVTNGIFHVACDIIYVINKAFDVNRNMFNVIYDMK